MLQDKALKNRLAKEFRFAAKKMQEASNPTQTLYYFSAFHGEASRILNWEWNRDVALMFIVLRQVHQEFTGRSQSPIPIKPPERLFEALTQAAQELANYVSEEKDNTEEFKSLMGRFAELAFVVTGNGSYLFDKGIIKF